MDVNDTKLNVNKIKMEYDTDQSESTSSDNGLLSETADEALGNEGNNLPNKRMNNLSDPVQPIKTSCWEQTVDNFIRFKNKTTTFRVFYVVILVFCLALLISLIFIFVPIAKDSQKISQHLDQTALLVQDCRQNSEFLRQKGQELQDKLNSCDKSLGDVTAKMAALVARRDSLQNEIWDLNAQIMAKNNEIFHLKTNGLGGKSETGFFAGFASLFSAGSPLSPSYHLIASVALIIFTMLS